MKFKSIGYSDIDDFRKLNSGFVEESKDELVRKIQEKYGINNEAVDLIDDINNDSFGDVVCGNQTSGVITYFMGDSSGIQTAQVINIGSFLWGVSSGDINNDGF